TVHVPEREEQGSGEERKNQSRADGIDGGMKKHRQKHASIRSIKKPGEQEGGAEERKEKSGNDWPWKFVTHERQMPERPERSEDQTRNQRRVFFCNCGSANPRQPGSSPKPMNK